MDHVTIKQQEEIKMVYAILGLCQAIIVDITVSLPVVQYVGRFDVVVLYPDVL